MSNNHFHLSLTVLLSLGLGYSLASSTATGYPAGSAISLGSNPVRSFGGKIDFQTEPSMLKSNIVSAPATHDLVVTDVLMGLTQIGAGCFSNGHLRLYDDDGVTYAEIPIYTTNIREAPSSTTRFQAGAGIRIPANTSLHAQWTFATQDCLDYYYDLHYTIGGYLAQQ